MRRSGWATDWPKAIQGSHELAQAADLPLRKGIGLIFLPAQERQKVEWRTAVKQDWKYKRRGDEGVAAFTTTPWRAVPLKLATLA